MKRHFAIRLCSLLAALLSLSVFNGLAQTPVLTNAMVSGGNFSFRILLASNQTFTIEVSSNLTSWTPVGSQTPNTNLVSVTDPRGVATFNRQFYRIVLGNFSVVDFHLQFLEFASAGNFGGGSTPVTTFPVSLNNYSTGFNVDNDTNYPAPANVFFTGPAGSGLTNTPADPSNSNTNSDGSAFYQSPLVSNPAAAPGGTWVVNYKGTNQTFSVPDPQAASRLVIPYPTITVTGGSLQNVSWVYRDATTGATLSGAPAYVSNIQLQVYGGSGTLFNSTNLPPTTTSQTVSPPVNYASISGIGLAYQDSLGNSYIVSFGP
jgi:hypothetical protein